MAKKSTVEEGVITPLDEIEPGTVVEMPENFKVVNDAKNMLFMGMERSVYNHDRIYPKGMVYRNNTLESRAFEEIPQESKWKVLKGNSAKEIKDRFAESAKKFEIVLPSCAAKCGSDPEGFVSRGDGSVIPAPDFLRSKDAEERYGYEPFWDGFQWEFTVKAQQCIEILMDNLWSGLRLVSTAAKAFDPQAKISMASVVNVTHGDLRRLDKGAVIFGCSPSINIYGDTGLVPNEPRAFLQRFAGGHMHYGIGKMSGGVIKSAVEALDGICAVACVGMFAGIDTPIRRKAYGLAGEIRLPQHGLEYRVLSNAWLLHPAIAMLTWEIFRFAARAGMFGLYKYIWPVDQDEVKRIVNECDVKAARALVKKNEMAFRWLMGQKNWRDEQHFDGHAINLALKVIYEGVGSVIAEPGNIEKNWRLDKKAHISNSSLSEEQIANDWLEYCRGKGCSWKSVSSLIQSQPAQRV